MVYISSRRFTQRTEANCEVKIYSNCGSVELLVNGKKYSTVGSSDNIFRSADIVLQPGANTILATAQKNGTTLCDSCTWYLSPAKQSAKSILPTIKSKSNSHCALSVLFAWDKFLNYPSIIRLWTAKNMES